MKDIQNMLMKNFWQQVEAVWEEHIPLHRIHQTIKDVEIKEEGWEYHLPLVRDLMMSKIGFSPYAFVVNSNGDVKQGWLDLRNNISNADWGQASSFEEFIFNQSVQKYWREFYSLEIRSKPIVTPVDGGFRFQLEELVGVILYDCFLEGSDFGDCEVDYTSEEIDKLKHLALLKEGRSYKHEYNTQEEQSLATYKEWLKRELVWHDDETHHGELMERFKATTNFSHTVAAILATIQSGYIPNYLDKLVSSQLFKELYEHCEFWRGWFHPEDEG